MNSKPKLLINMRNLTSSLYILVLAMCFTNCATVKIYDKNEKEKGLKIYTSKPYLLVEKSITKDSASIKSSIIHLQNLNDPQYVKFVAGFGSNELSMTLKNSILTSYGVKSDSKIPESVSSLSELTTALAGLKSQDSGSGTEQGGTGDDVSLNNAKEDLDIIIRFIESSSNSNFDKEDLVNNLKSISDELAPNQLQGDLDKFSQFLDRIEESSKTNRLPADLKDKLENYVKKYRKLVNGRAESIPNKLIFELYEIIMDDNGTVLKKVEWR